MLVRAKSDIGGFLYMNADATCEIYESSYFNESRVVSVATTDVSRINLDAASGRRPLTVRGGKMLSWIAFD